MVTTRPGGRGLLKICVPTIRNTEAENCQYVALEIRCFALLLISQEQINIRKTSKLNKSAIAL